MDLKKFATMDINMLLSVVNMQLRDRYDDLLKSSAGELFGPGNARLPAPPMLMLDRIVHIDDAGRIVITDRKKDLIVNDKGDNVAPQKVEGMLTLQPEIMQAMIAGDRKPYMTAVLVPDPEWTQEWCAKTGAKCDLKALREARLVTSRKDGKFVVYRLTGPDVAGLWVTLRQVAEEHLVELRVAIDQMVAEPSQLVSLDRKTLMAQARRGEVVVIDVRPPAEYEQAHLPYARSMPLAAPLTPRKMFPPPMTRLTWTPSAMTAFTSLAMRLTISGSSP